MDLFSSCESYLGPVTAKQLSVRATGQKLASGILSRDRVRYLWSRLHSVSLYRVDRWVLILGRSEYESDVRALINYRCIYSEAEIEMLALCHAMWEHHNWNLVNELPDSIIPSVSRELARIVCPDAPDDVTLESQQSLSELGIFALKLIRAGSVFSSLMIDDTSSVALGLMVQQRVEHLARIYHELDLPTIQ